MARARLSNRLLPLLVAVLGLALLAAAGTWTYFGMSQASLKAQRQTSEVQQESKRIASAMTTYVRRDADLLTAMSRDPAFANWIDASGTTDEKLQHPTPAINAQYEAAGDALPIGRGTARGKAASWVNPPDADPGSGRICVTN